MGNSPSTLGGLLGQILSNGVPQELSGGINFLGGLLARFNPSTLLTEVSFGDVADHGGLQIADGLHGAAAGSFPSAALRKAATYAAGDVNKIVLQTDTTPATKWWIDSVTAGVAAFSQITTTPESTASPLTIFGSSLLGWYRGDAVTLGTGVSSWTDQTGNGNHLIQATTGAQPAYTANDSTLNGRGTLLGNGTSTFLNCVAMSVPADCFIWFIMKQVSWTVNGKMMNWPAGGSLIQGSATPSMIGSFAGSNSADNTGAPLGAWKRGYARLDDTTADAIALGSVVKTGTALGRTAATNNTTVFSNYGGSNQWWNGALAEIAIVNRVPTGPELTAIDAYGSSYYLPSILA